MGLKEGRTHRRWLSHLWLMATLPSAFSQTSIAQLQAQEMQPPPVISHPVEFVSSPSSQDAELMPGAPSQPAQPPVPSPFAESNDCEAPWPHVM